jgi:hypothetical protein
MPPARKKAVIPAADPNRDHPAVVKKDLRVIFRDAFDSLGGAAWLVNFVRADPQNARTFVQAIARLMPLELTGKDGAALTVIVQSADGKQTPVDLNPPPIEGESVRMPDGRTLN